MSKLVHVIRIMMGGRHNHKHFGCEATPEMRWCVRVLQGWDKTYCLRYLNPADFDEIHFFGDKTFEVSAPRPTLTRQASSPPCSGCWTPFPMELLNYRASELLSI
jgi:hypothetical protein